jgi:predicted phage tail protein
MGLNRTAKGIVLVPSLLLGGAFLSAGVWGAQQGAGNRPLALGLGAVLLLSGLLTQLLPEPRAEGSDDTDAG